MITDEEYDCIRPGDIITFPADAVNTHGFELIVSDIDDDGVCLIDGWEGADTPTLLDREEIQPLCRLNGRAKIVIER
jgi:hypothetical protein